MWYIKGARMREANIGIAQDKFLKQPLLLPVSYFFLPFFVCRKKSAAKNCTSRKKCGLGCMKLSLFFTLPLYHSPTLHILVSLTLFWLFSFFRLLPLFNSCIRSLYTFPVLRLSPNCGDEVTIQIYAYMHILNRRVTAYMRKRNANVCICPSILIKCTE